MKMNVSTISETPPANRSIGAILLDSGQLKPEDAEHILRLQKEQNLRFGEAAVRLGLLTDADVQYALSRQYSYRYLRINSDKRPISEEVVAAYQPFSPLVEQLRAIRSQLMLRWYDKAEQRQILTVVGAERGEGRSYLAANLAVVFSQLGERTLLIDANLRTPRQHELFKLKNSTGLSTLLAGRARDEAIIRITDLTSLYVLSAGPVPPNPLELLSRNNLDEFLARARSMFDMVIVDTPALSVGEDAAMIAMRTGAALAVARSTQTRVSAFSDMVQGLMYSGVSIVGSVLNEVPVVKSPGRAKE
ncbi:chain length determinant protein tyrosine kinase EpsG [Sphaerotilaceae bacterium SBD11-9]